ncbi:MAG TPA: hypothetical protein VH062_28655 [Polyangiaceae bacterium]|jgi:hypothetical protein|nr:hypothetical protein [Polyangiaceae bacterium]
MHSKPKALFICGSLNQTKQMHAVARELPELDAWFTPFFVEGFLDGARKAHLLDTTIAGFPWVAKCEAYLAEHGLSLDYQGRRFHDDYELIVTCQDVYVSPSVRRLVRDGVGLVLVQEGMTDPENFMYHVVKRVRFLPRWFASTAATGLSQRYDRFCVASEGYRDLFVRKGCEQEKLVVTGIPNFDDMARYLQNDLADRDYVLVCTSDARETFKMLDDREDFLRNALAIAGDRRVVVKLHPNEDVARATRELRALAPDVTIVPHGSAEEMVANCSVLVVQYSTLAFVGLALGKDVYAKYPVDELRRLLPLQNGGTSGAAIAQVCREVFASRKRRSSVTKTPRAESAHEATP